MFKVMHHHAAFAFEVRLRRSCCDCVLCALHHPGTRVDLSTAYPSQAWCCAPFNPRRERIRVDIVSNNLEIVGRAAVALG